MCHCDQQVRIATVTSNYPPFTFPWAASVTPLCHALRGNVWSGCKVKGVHTQTTSTRFLNLCGKRCDISNNNRNTRSHVEFLILINCPKNPEDFLLALSTDIKLTLLTSPQVCKRNSSLVSHSMVWLFHHTQKSWISFLTLNLIWGKRICAVLAWHPWPWKGAGTKVKDMSQFNGNTGSGLQQRGNKTVMSSTPNNQGVSLSVEPCLNVASERSPQERGKPADNVSRGPCVLRSLFGQKSLVLLQQPAHICTLCGHQSVVAVVAKRQHGVPTATLTNCSVWWTLKNKWHYLKTSVLMCS